MREENEQIIFERSSSNNMIEIKISDLPKDLHDDDIIRASHGMHFGNSTFFEIIRK